MMSGLPAQRPAGGKTRRLPARAHPLVNGPERGLYFEAPSILPSRPPLNRGLSHERVMKVRASVRRMCEKCKIVRRRGVVFVVCMDPRHKQRQG